MSLRRKNINEGRREQIDLCQLSKFLRIIGVMIGALLIMTVILFVFSSKAPETNVVYTIIIVINGIVTLVSLLVPTYFEKKQREIEEKSKNNY